MKTNLPILIVGAGPIGLAAAAHCSIRKLPFLVIEAGEVGENVRSWSHVAMFSPWEYNLDKAACDLLTKEGWQKPELHLNPSGADLLRLYLEPLSQLPAIAPHLKLHTKVLAIARKSIPKVKNAHRQAAPFLIKLQSQEQPTYTIEARAVIDASGTWQNPGPIGASGLFAQGEETVKNKVFYGIPDVLNTHKNRFFDKHVAVVGGGHSAINVLLELADLKRKSAPVWIMTKSRIEDAYGGLGDDELPGRGKLGLRIQELVTSGNIKVVTPFFIDEMKSDQNKIQLRGRNLEGPQTLTVDEIVANTGTRPDLSFLRELRIQLHPALECPHRLGPLIDPNIHSCGTVAPHGEAELRHPEKDFYIVGMKSYGRAPTFLLATGYEQGRSVVAALAGDWEAARKVQLRLPQTGVCGVQSAPDPNKQATTSNTGRLQNPCC